MWLAAWTASVPPAPGAMPVPEYRLKQRIRSLAAAGLDVRIETPPGQPDRLLVARDFRGGRRSIGMRLTFVSGSPGGHCVLAREVSLIRGDKPMNASEARMSSSIRSRDGTHPDADLIYDAGLTVTLPSDTRSEEHTSELQSLMRISYAVFCLKKKTKQISKHQLQKK